MSNTKIWDQLCKTDPKHTSHFKRSGGFSGTAIKPIWSFHRMTEIFGACGDGWGVGEPMFQVVPAGDEIMVFCTASIWHGSKDKVVWGVGGDKVIAKFSSGLRSDDEAFKKAFTDAITNALKLIGVGGDVHMGMFEDSKYVTALRAEFAEPKRDNPHVNRVEDFHEEISNDIPDTPISGSMLVKTARPEYKVLLDEMHRIQDVMELREWGEARAEQINSLPGQWPAMFKGEYTKHKKTLLGEKAA